jgi:uncharacterized protein YqhQ
MEDNQHDNADKRNLTKKQVQKVLLGVPDHVNQPFFAVEEIGYFSLLVGPEHYDFDNDVPERKEERDDHKEQTQEEEDCRACRLILIDEVFAVFFRQIDVPVFVLSFFFDISQLPLRLHLVKRCFKIFLELFVLYLFAVLAIFCTIEDLVEFARPLLFF